MQKRLHVMLGWIKWVRVNIAAPQGMQDSVTAFERDLAFSGASAQQDRYFSKIALTDHVAHPAEKRKVLNFP
jgi:hypothetical protein